MSLIVDNDLFEFNLITPTPRQTTFSQASIQIPTVPYPPESLSPYSSPDLSASPYSSPSPQTDYSTTTSVSISPSSTHHDLPSDVDDIVNSLNFTAPLSSSKPKLGPRSRADPPPRKGDPSYIPRPENAFILFRKDAVAKMRAAEALEAAQSEQSGEKAKRQRQADMSKCISHMWKSLSAEDRSQWEERAARIKREHEAKHPDYRYQPARPGTTNKRTGPGRKVRLIRSKQGNTEEDYVLRGGLSEELSIVVRPTRAPRRSSTASTASSVSSFASPISLPSIDNLSRSESPFPTQSFVRTPRSRQWVQPPVQDPSPPPSEIYFPRGSVPPGLEMFAPSGGALEASPIARDEVRSVSLSQRRAKQSPTEDKAAVFVEPITSDKNPWTGGKFPVPPRRSRPRSHSQPQPTQYQPTTVEIAPPHFELDMAWTTEQIPEMTPSPASSSSYGAPWDETFSVPQSAIIDQSIISEGECTTTDFSSWDWGTFFAPLDLSTYISGQHTMDYSDPQQDASRTFNVVNLDPQGRPRPFF